MTDTISKKVTHCDKCGDTWYDSGIASATCPHCRIAELEKLIPLVEEIIYNHRDQKSLYYNECEKPEEECLWCDMAKKAISKYKEIK